MNISTRIDRKFFRRPTLDVARDLLGKHLVRLEADGSRTVGIISETEAYIGTEDLGCHASSGRTARNESMWGAAGHAYVYFIYGMHWMLNFTTEETGFPAAVLLRAVVPLEGRERIGIRRSKQLERNWTNGPAKVCQAFAIDGSIDGLDLCSESAPIYVENGARIPDSSVTTSPRVGLYSVQEPWKSVPWRFQIKPDYEIKETR